MRAAAVAALAALLLAACPGPNPEKPENASGSKTSTTTSNPQAVPENSSSMNPVVPPQKEMPGSGAGAAAQPADIDVQLTEYEIRMPEATPAGPHRFRIANAGKTNHNFAIEGPGVTQKMANDLTRGDSGEIVVTLQPGSYTIYCPVDGHRGKGMQRTLTVK